MLPSFWRLSFAFSLKGPSFSRKKVRVEQQAVPRLSKGKLMAKHMFVATNLRKVIHLPSVWVRPEKTRVVWLKYIRYIDENWHRWTISIRIIMLHFVRFETDQHICSKSAPYKNTYV